MNLANDVSVLHSRLELSVREGNVHLWFWPKDDDGVSIRDCDENWQHKHWALTPRQYVRAVGTMTLFLSAQQRIKARVEEAEKE